MDISSISSVLTSIPVLIGLLIVGWQFKQARQIIAFVFKLIPAALLFLFGAVAYILWLPVGWLSDRMVTLLPVERIALLVLDKAARSRGSWLVQGEREAFAKSVWPMHQYPDLYTAVPDDIKRPPFEDGRLLGGIGIGWLADRFVTETSYLSAVRAGFKAALVVFVAVLIYLVFGVVFEIIAFLPALLEGETPIVEQWPGDEPERLSILSLILANFDAAFTDLVANIGVYALWALAALPLAAGAGMLVAVLLLATWMRAKAEPYRLITKDADVRWPYRSETRALLRQTFRKQIEQATGYLKDAMVYPVGDATGTLRARGDLSAPMPDQTIKLDRESLFQHVLVFGGTGEGKTTALLKPLLRQVLSDRQFGAFLADAKGVLWGDAAKVAASVGRADDVIIIGTGSDQHGLDPIANLTPTQVAATLRSVLRQMGSESKDDFWPEMASTIIRHVLTVGWAYARTEAGKEEFQKEGVNPYSLWWAYQAIIQSGNKKNEFLNKVMASLSQSREADFKDFFEARKAGNEENISAFGDHCCATYTKELDASLDYIDGAWANMADNTKSSIIASVTQLLDGFSGSPILRDRFASGKSDTTDVLKDALNGKIVLNALSTIEDGLPARLTSILIKTALYREARVREAELKRAGGGERPQDKPCLVMMDEVQELATVDPVSGLSDASFWNVARSTGLAGVFATQTIAALTQAMGKEAADNFMQQARSKVFFRTEEQTTVEYACWCAGEFERNRVFDDDHRESLEYRSLIDGWDPLHPVDEGEEISAGPRAFFYAAIGLINPNRLSVAQHERRPTYEADTRFLAIDGQGGGNSASMGSLQNAIWRAEDLTRSYRTEGNEREKALTPADLIHMGRWHAFAQIQRAGAVRQDIIRVEHNFD